MSLNPLNYQPSRSAVYYTPPRRMDPQRAVVGFLVGALAGAVGGLAYALIQQQLHYMVLRIGEVVCGALAVGVIASSAVSYGRVRSPLLAAAMGAAVAMIALYTMWIVWLHGYFENASIQVTYAWLLRHPIAVFRLVRIVNVFGTWNYHGEPVSGPGLWIIWALEAMPILLSGVLFPLKAMPGDVACLSCGRECTLVRPIARSAIDCKDELLARVEGREFAPLAAFAPPPCETAEQLSVRLMSCPDCGQTNVLTVNHIGFTTDHSGSRKMNLRPLVNQLMLPPGEVAELRDAFKQMTEIRAVEKSETR
jgi:hypothetical protein